MCRAMLSLCIKLFIFVHGVCATNKGVAQKYMASKDPFTSEVVIMLQRFAAKSNSTPSQARDQGKLDEETALLETIRTKTKTEPVMKHTGKCVVWHSQHKSAGRVVELMLEGAPLKMAGLQSGEEWRKMWAKSLYRCDCDQPTFDCSTTRCVPPGTMRDKSHYRVAYRGYTGTLVGSKEFGRPGDGSCVWATMSREPVSRLISAYYYCKRGVAHDPLCGLHGLNAKEATIHDWAKHWGNYLFRELLLSTDVRSFAVKQPDFIHKTTACDTQAWLSWKYQLNGGDDPRTKSGNSNLMELEKHMRGKASPLYDIYGVVERWEDTMALFDDMLPLDENKTWAETTSKVDIDHDSKFWKSEEMKSTEAARHDPVVLAELAADIHLYNKVILPEFDKRIRILKR